ALSTSQDALRAVEFLCGAAVLLQALENLRNIAEVRETGTFRWSLMRAEIGGVPTPIVKLLDRVMDPHAIGALCLVQCACALAMMLAPQWWCASSCALVTLLVAVRWRGSVNGGSDSITLITLLCAGIGRGFDHDERVVTGALAYLALQSIASYLIAGVVKLRSSRWRSGEALRHFVQSAAVGPPPRILHWSLEKRRAQIAAVGLILFELGAPMALLSPKVTPIFIAVALCFHAVNAWVLGLHRFLWAWLATYPAVYFTASLLG
ncbi:MAG: HTTM domain-containing protein, partial [Nannocystaceae bacterium]